MSKSALRAFGLALMAVLGLMAFSAVAAQAEDLTDGGKVGLFLILGSGPLVVGLSEAFKDVGLPGLMLIDGKNTFIECQKNEILESKGVTDKEILVRVRFKECATHEDTKNGAGEYPVLTSCPIEGENSSLEKGSIDALAIALPILHGGNLYVLFHPEPESSFATINFSSSCGIGFKVKVKGLVIALVDNGNAAADHLIIAEPSLGKLLGVKLLFGASSEALFTGVAHVTLKGSHLNCTWAVD